MFLTFYFVILIKYISKRNETNPKTKPACEFRRQSSNNTPEMMLQKYLVNRLDYILLSFGLRRVWYQKTKGYLTKLGLRVAILFKVLQNLQFLSLRAEYFLKLFLEKFTLTFHSYIEILLFFITSWIININLLFKQKYCQKYQKKKKNFEHDDVDEEEIKTKTEKHIQITFRPLKVESLKILNNSRNNKCDG